MVDFIHMRRDLTAPINAPRWPRGISLAELENGDAREIHALLTLAYSAGGGGVGDFETWWTGLLTDLEFDRNLCVVAKDERDRIVGFIQCWTTAFIKDVVVHPEARRQGLAEAMLNHAFGLFQALGMEHVDLKVEKGNPTGAIRLYERMGMVVMDD
jgi:ribosomal protein S18 acetylase RimI-like enzyme